MTRSDEGTDHANHHLAEVTKDVIRRPDFRRAIITGAIALAAPADVWWIGGVQAPEMSHRIGAWVGTAACAGFGVVAVRTTANEVARLVRPRGGLSVAGGLRLLITLVGYVLVLITVLGLLSVPVDRLLLSGAITGVIVGIAAQQSLANAFAGLVLLLSRPFAVGDYITLYSGALGGPYQGTVTAITMTYTVMETAQGRLSFPNSGVLAAATGPRPRPPAPDPAAPDPAVPEPVVPDAAAPEAVKPETTPTNPATPLADQN